MNKMKLNYPYLKKWMGTIINKGESFSEYDNKPPSMWDESMFSNWFLDNAVDHSNTANQFTEKIFGIPKGTKLISFFETKDNPGSGFNGNKNWNRFGSIKSALYDVWAEIKRNTGSVKSEGKLPMTNIQKVKRMIQSEIASPKKLNEDKTFDEQEFKDLIGDAVIKMWEGYNEIETSLNYMKIRGQGGAVNPFIKKYNIKQLEMLLSALDAYSSH